MLYGIKIPLGLLNVKTPVPGQEVFEPQRAENWKCILEIHCHRHPLS